MKKDHLGQLVFSPSDLVRYVGSPFASWMDRYSLENPGAVIPDEETEDERLIAQTGEKHERAVLDEFKLSGVNLVEVSKHDPVVPQTTTISAISDKVPIIYQAALEHGPFAGFADFLLLDESGRYQVWDTKLARSPKPHYAIQLCCYSDLLAAMTGGPMPDTFGLILGSNEKVLFRVEDFLHYYRHIKAGFLGMQEGFTGNLIDRPEPLPRADHGRWTSHAEKFFHDTDHLVQVAGITVGQIKKLKRAGIATVADLALASDQSVPNLAQDSLDRLAAQARLQFQTRTDRIGNPDAPPRYEILPYTGTNNEPVGLAALPHDHPADVFFDMEGYPLVVGGLEYLFGVCTRSGQPDSFDFMDWWAHTSEEEQLAFEGFVDWVFTRWQSHPGMHIYHYAPYEVSAVRRLSTRHDTRQDEVDELLRNEVFVDLCRIVRQGLRIGEDSYSLKTVERLYRPKRDTEVATAADSIVQYARWIESRQPGDWHHSTILKNIRDYNADDCMSTAELLQWLRNVVVEHQISAPLWIPIRLRRCQKNCHRRSLRDWIPRRSFARRGTGFPLSLRISSIFTAGKKSRCGGGCLTAPKRRPTHSAMTRPASRVFKPSGLLHQEKLSLVQAYRFDPSQECKLAAGDRSKVMFTHNLRAKFTLLELDGSTGNLCLKIGKKGLNEKCGGLFPQQGSLLPDEHVSATTIPDGVD
jgi:predicted RecB family nuclease